MRWDADGAQQVHRRLAFVADTLKFCQTDLMHFVAVMMYFATVNGVLLHLAFGPLIERLSTLGGAIYVSFELNVAGSYGQMITELEEKGLVGSPCAINPSCLPLSRAAHGASSLTKTKN